MALEEQAVIAGLGLSFSRMAEEFVQLPQSTGPSRDLLAEAYAKRQAFGKQYVEKLLNIVVQVRRWTRLSSAACSPVLAEHRN